MLLDPYRPGAPEVYRLTPTTTTDSYGDPVESWATPGRTRLPGAEVQHRTTEETDEASRRIVRTEHVLTAPGAIALESSDRIEVDGEIWLVDGDPDVRRGFLDVYTTVTVRRLTGGRT